MSEETFGQHYERLTDNELAQLIADRQDLVPEAAEALDQEVQRRNYVSMAPPEWTQPPDSDGKVQCLEDYDSYRQLVEKKQAFGRYGYVLAMGPFILGLLLVRKGFENSTVLVIGTLSWAMCVFAYGLILNVGLLGFRCPQCSQSFGRSSECFNCGFPRSANP